MMQQQALTCNNCGAALDVPPTANYATCVYCGSRLAIKRTDSAAYTEVLSDIDQRTKQIARDTARMSSDLATIRLRGELEMLDRQWTSDEQPYLAKDRDGKVIAPNLRIARTQVITSLGLMLFGVLVMLDGFVAGDTSGFLIAVIAAGVGLVFLPRGLQAQALARRYEAARSLYLQNRQRILADLSRQ